MFVLSFLSAGNSDTWVSRGEQLQIPGFLHIFDTISLVRLAL